MHALIAESNCQELAEHNTSSSSSSSSSAQIFRQVFKRRCHGKNFSKFCFWYIADTACIIFTKEEFELSIYYTISLLLVVQPNLTCNKFDD
jgi:acyl-homoserine lactone acylase PvdQ